MSKLGFSAGTQTGHASDALWLNVSPGFQRLDSKLLGCLAHHVNLVHWAYRQTPDEPSSLEIALTLLHDYMKGQQRPLHILGHGTAGLLGLLYARRYPQWVKSLTLLAVGVNPMLDWQAHYYTQLETQLDLLIGNGSASVLGGDRNRVLQQMVYTLFGYQAKPLVNGWVKLLEKDLAHSPSPHSLLKRASLCPGSVEVPLLVCGSQDDAIIPPNQIQGWRPWLKEGDRLWQCSGGRHFFHAVYPQKVAGQVLSFWKSTDTASMASLEVETAL